MRYLLLVIFLAVSGCAVPQKRQPLTLDEANRYPDRELCLALVDSRFSQEEKNNIYQALDERKQNCDAYRTFMDAKMADQQQRQQSRAIRQQNSDALNNMALQWLKQSQPVSAPGITCYQQGIYTHCQ